MLSVESNLFLLPSMVKNFSYWNPALWKGLMNSGLSVWPSVHLPIHNTLFSESANFVDIVHEVRES